jgi:hypothetical protein
LLGVGDGFCVSAFLVLEGELVSDSVVLCEVVESSVEVVLCWSSADVELSVAAESEAEVLFAAPEADEPSDAAESDRFHCRRHLLGSVFLSWMLGTIADSPSTSRR